MVWVLRRAIATWSAVTGTSYCRRQLDHLVAQRLLAQVGAVLRGVLDRVLELVVRVVGAEQVPRRIGHERHDRQFQQRADHQRVWWNIRSQRVRVKKCANTDTRPLTVAPALSSW